jgi:hypothetical protein
MIDAARNLTEMGFEIDVVSPNKPVLPTFFLPCIRFIIMLLQLGFEARPRNYAWSLRKEFFRENQRHGQMVQ